jgi:hypothetical protein
MPYGQYPLVPYFLHIFVLYRLETSVLIIILWFPWAKEHYIKLFKLIMILNINLIEHFNDYKYNSILNLSKFKKLI